MHLEFKENVCGRNFIVFRIINIEIELKFMTIDELTKVFTGITM
jgi:hypothetical protein